MTEEQQSSIKPRAASASSIRSFPLQEAEAFDFAADTVSTAALTHGNTWKDLSTTQY